MARQNNKSNVTRIGKRHSPAAKKSARNGASTNLAGNATPGNTNPSKTAVPKTLLDRAIYNTCLGLFFIFGVALAIRAFADLRRDFDLEFAAGHQESAGISELIATRAAQLHQNFVSLQAITNVGDNIPANALEFLDRKGAQGLVGIAIVSDSAKILDQSGKVILNPAILDLTKQAARDRQWALGLAPATKSSSRLAIVYPLDNHASAIFFVNPDRFLPAPLNGHAFGLMDARGDILWRGSPGMTTTQWPQIDVNIARSGIQVRSNLGLTIVASHPLATKAGEVIIIAPAIGWSQERILNILFLILLFIAPSFGAVGLINILKEESATNEALRVASEQFSPVEDTKWRDSSIPLWEWNPSENQFLINAALGHALEIRAQSPMTRLDILGRVHADDRLAFEDMLDRGSLKPFQHVFRFPLTSRVLTLEFSGERRLLHDAISKIDHRLPSAARADYRLSGTATDQTRRIAVDNPDKVAHGRLDDVVESFPGPFALFDTRQRLVIANRRYQQQFGPEGENFWAGASYDVIAISAQARIKAAYPDPADSHARLIEMIDGRWYKIVDRRTNDKGIITIGVDITAQKHVEMDREKKQRELHEINKRLSDSEYRASQLARQYEVEKLRAEEASHAKSAFLANMSHELRTPLNAIIGFSEVMANELFGPLGSEKYRTYSKDIWESGQHLLDLISDVLDTAKIEAGKMSLHLAPVDLEDVVESAVRLIRRRADEKHIELSVRLGDVMEIEADHRALKQMILNLLSNAIKFTDENGRVALVTEHVDDEVRIHVKDNGIGISAEYLPRLAKPFEQVENQHSRNHAGTGLGLALTKSLVEMHGGRMQIDSVVGQGTTVTLAFPTKTNPQGTQGSQPATGAPSASGSIAA